MINKNETKENCPNCKPSTATSWGKSTEGWTYFKLHYSGDGDLLTLLIASFADCAFSFTTSPKQAGFRAVFIFLLQMQGHSMAQFM